MNRFFVVVPANQRKSYVHESDRVFFSVPVEVVPDHCDRIRKTLFVRSPLQSNAVYPVGPENLKRESQLTRRQRESARRLPG